MTAPATAVQALAKIPFKNAYAGTIPPLAVMAVVGIEVSHGTTFLVCDQPGAALATAHALNGASAVPAGQRGVCFRQGDVQVLFADGEPQPGEIWGVRRGSWALAKGHPGVVTVHGVVDAAYGVLHGQVHSAPGVVGAPLTTLVPRSGSVAGAAIVAAYVVVGGALVPADPPMTFTGYNLGTTPIAAGSPTQFVLSNGSWIAAGGPDGEEPEGTEANLVSFRLPDRLATGDASLGSCPVIDYWNGLDPGATITVHNLETDYPGVYKFHGDANAVGYALYVREDNQYQIIALEGDGRRWQLYRNDSSATAPACCLLQETGCTMLDGGHSNTRPVLTCTRPNASYTDSFWVNGYAEVPAGHVGVCCSSESPVEILIESSGGVSNGTSIGPAPGQFTAKKGHPGFRVIGLTNNSRVLAVQKPWHTLRAKTTQAVELSQTMAYRLYANNTDIGWTDVPGARVDGPIASGIWCDLLLLNDRLELRPVRRSGTRLANATLSAALNASDSQASLGEVNSLDDDDAPNIATAENRHNLAADSGTLVTLAEDTSGGSAVWYVLMIKPKVGCD